MIAKPLAVGLNLLRQQRVTSLVPTASQSWSLRFEDAAPAITADAVVLAIPALQALELLEPIASQLPAPLLHSIRSVQYDPCFSVIATYAQERSADLAALPWQAIEFSNHAELVWLSNESSKRDTKKALVVLQSTAAFAVHHLEADELISVGQQLLRQAAQLLDWLETPDSMQVHQWRYAFVNRSIEAAFLTSSVPLPLICSGDWCGGGQLEGALRSGFAAAIALQQQLVPSTQTSTVQEDAAAKWTALLSSLAI